MEKFIKEFNAKHKTNLNFNGIDRYLSIDYINDLCQEYLNYVNDFGNECAYTDSIVTRIIEWSQNITEEI